MDGTVATPLVQKKNTKRVETICATTKANTGRIQPR